MRMKSLERLRSLQNNGGGREERGDKIEGRWRENWKGEGESMYLKRRRETADSNEENSSKMKWEEKKWYDSWKVTEVRVNKNVF